MSTDRKTIPNTETSDAIDQDWLIPAIDTQSRDFKPKKWRSFKQDIDPSTEDATARAAAAAAQRTADQALTRTGGGTRIAEWDANQNYSTGDTVYYLNRIFWRTGANIASNPSNLSPTGDSGWTEISPSDALADDSVTPPTLDADTEEKQRQFLERIRAQGIPVMWGRQFGSPNPLLTGGASWDPEIINAAAVNFDSASGRVRFNTATNIAANTVGGLGHRAESEKAYAFAVGGVFRAITTTNDNVPRWSLALFVGGSANPTGNNATDVPNAQSRFNGAMMINFIYGGSEWAHRNESGVQLRYVSNDDTPVLIKGDDGREWRAGTFWAEDSDIHFMIVFKRKLLDVYIAHGDFSGRVLHNIDISNWDQAGDYNGFFAYQQNTRFELSDYYVAPPHIVALLTGFIAEYTRTEKTKLATIEENAKDDQSAAEVPVETASFNRNLSSADSTVQAALQTLDQLVAGSGDGVSGDGGITPTEVGTANVGSASASDTVSTALRSEVGDLFSIHIQYDRSGFNNIEMSALLLKSDIGADHASQYPLQIQGGGGANIGLYWASAAADAAIVIDSQNAAGYANIQVTFYKLEAAGRRGEGGAGSYERQLFRSQRIGTPPAPSMPNTIAAPGRIPGVPTHWSETPPVTVDPIYVSLQRIDPNETVVRYSAPRQWSGTPGRDGTTFDNAQNNQRISKVELLTAHNHLRMHTNWSNSGSAAQAAIYLATTLEGIGNDALPTKSWATSKTLGSGDTRIVLLRIPTGNDISHYRVRGADNSDLSSGHWVFHLTEGSYQYFSWRDPETLSAQTYYVQVSTIDQNLDYDGHFSGTIADSVVPPANWFTTLNNEARAARTLLAHNSIYNHTEWLNSANTAHAAIAVIDPSTLTSTPADYSGFTYGVNSGSVTPTGSGWLIAVRVPANAAPRTTGLLGYRVREPDGTLLDLPNRWFYHQTDDTYDYWGWGGHTATQTGIYTIQISQKDEDIRFNGYFDGKMNAAAFLSGIAGTPADGQGVIYNNSRAEWGNAGGMSWGTIVERTYATPIDSSYNRVSSNPSSRYIGHVFRATSIDLSSATGDILAISIKPKNGGYRGWHFYELAEYLALTAAVASTSARGSDPPLNVLPRLANALGDTIFLALRHLQELDNSKDHVTIGALGAFAIGRTADNNMLLAATQKIVGIQYSLINR